MDRTLPQAYDSADPIDPTAETVINAAPYVAGEVHSDDRPDATASPIKGRVVTVASRYFAAQRDTVGG
jgi:hypothetical protein